MMPDIVMKNISKSFGEKRVLDHFDAVLHSGTVNCLLGASGAGKTTIARILCGLETQDEGTVTGLEGLKLSAVFQEDRLCESLSAVTNVSFVANISREQATEALLEVGLRTSALQSAGTLSGGQKRRVALVRAVVSDFDLLILDEPFKGLDDDTKNLVIDWVRDRIATKTVVLITHDEREAQRLGCSSVIRLS